MGTRHTISPLNVTKQKRINIGSTMSVDCELVFNTCGLKLPHFLWSILVTGKSIIGYEKNSEIQRNILTNAAKSINVEDSSESKLRVMMSLVSGPNDR